MKITKQEKKEIISWLIDTFPQAFFERASEIKPLQIGIFKLAILEFYERLNPPFSTQALKEGLQYYSSSPAYLNCQKEGVARIDIFGNEVDIVTKQQAEYAFDRFQKLYNKKIKA